ncbi:ceramidase domain-containing protein [Terracoccus sp. 273MFTsu3.1]|uniref:ceramidase domain-containing protein n=1 Tax=Terracoccus sp. 273MFTsu3.1 TaxID=1172188 RepID=UPI0003606608|nr:ceramidase domain-containing protein [Terracoccus sp. 273MFTsu3.1]
MPADGATCLATRCFCELARPDGIAQPADAWSSLAFVVAGVAAAAVLRPAARPERVLVPLLAVALVAVGIGSFAFHATLTLWGQFVDVLPMYAVGCVLLAGALVRLRRVTPRVAVLGGVALLAALGVLLWLWPESRRVLFAAVLLPGIVLELVAAPGRDGGARWLRVGLGLLVTAYALWLLDQAGLLCDPTSPLQGHAAWHVLGAGAGWCLARHWATRRLVA